MIDLVLEKRVILMMHGTILMATIINDCVTKEISFILVIIGISGLDLLAAISTQLKTYWMTLVVSFEHNYGCPTLENFLPTIETCWEDLRELLHLILSMEATCYLMLNIRRVSHQMLSLKESCLSLLDPQRYRQAMLGC